MDEEMTQRVKHWCDDNGIAVVRMCNARENVAEAEVRFPTHGTATLMFEANGDALDVTMIGVC